MVIQRPVWLQHLVRYPLIRDGLGLLAIAAGCRLVASATGLPVATTTLLGSIAIGVAARRCGTGLQLDFTLPLSCGMVLLGVQFVPARLAAVGPTAPLWLLGYWLLVAALFAFAVRARWFEARVGGILAVGIAGAGITAVRAAARADRSLPPDTLQLATAGILGAGALGFVATGEIARMLTLDAAATARWVGIAMPTTAEAVLVGAGHSPTAQQLTAAWRLLINVLQFVPIVGYLVLFVPDHDRPGRLRVARTTVRAIRRVPLFVWALAVVGAFAFVETFTPAERAVLQNVTNWAFLMALAGIGFNTRPGDIARLGARRIVAMVLIWITATALLLAMVCAC
ncbi:MAG: YeiH family protein [bacterium]|nr:YeiH family protein [bacterium]